ASVDGYRAVQRVKAPVEHPADARLPRHAQVGLRAARAWHGMAFGATLTVEHWPQAICDGLHVTELGQSGVEIRQLRAGQTRQWIGQIPSRLRVGPLRQQQDENACCRDKY